MTTELSYARALFHAASEKEMLPVAAEQLGLLEPLVKKHGRFFFNPGLPTSLQVQALRDCLDKRADPLIVQFLALLAARRHMKLLSAIQRHFEALYREATGDLVVHLRIPYEPDQALLDKMRGALAELALYPSERKEFVRFDIKIDGSLIGGFTAECGGRVLDASLRTKLWNLYNA